MTGRENASSRTSILVMLASGLCVCLLAGLTGFASGVISPLMWGAIFGGCWYGGKRFWLLDDRHAQRCFGWMGFLFVLSMALGVRLDVCKQTGWDGLVLALAVSACAGPAAAWFFACLAQWLSSRKADTAPEKRSGFWFTFVLLLAAWLPALLAYYPGIHAYDSFSQIPEYMNRDFSTHHPLLHTLWVGSLYELGGALGSYRLGMLMYSLTQMMLLAGAVAYAMRELAAAGCPRGMRISLKVLFCLFPQYALHVIGCTKDIPFAALMLLFLTLLYRLCREPQSKYRARFWTGLVASGVLMCLMRNNASYALVLFAPAAVLCVGRGQRRRMLALLAGVLVLFLGCANGLQAVTGAKDGLINEMFSIPAQQLARVYNTVDEEALVRYEIVECVPYAAQYNERLSDPVKLHLAIRTPQQLLKFVKFWGREFFHYPTVYVDAFLYSTKGFWDLNDWNAMSPPIFLWFYETLGVEQQCYLPPYKQLCESWLAHGRYQSVPLLSLMLQPAFYVWLTLFVLFTAMWRRDIALTIIALCALAYLATLLLGPIVNNRYIFCLMLCAPVMLGLISIPAKNKTE